MPFRIGFGYDIHRLEENHDLWLGGVLIPHSHGTVGHSDADTLIHAVIDALLGAAGLRDIGFHFPDTDPQFRGVSSKVLLSHVMGLLKEHSWTIGNIDITVVLQKPKLSPFIPEIVATLAATMDILPEQVSVKAKTSENIGFVGREEGVAVYAVALVQNN